MSKLVTYFFSVSLMWSVQQSIPASSQSSDVMLAAVSRNARMTGEGPAKTASGTAYAEPLARLTSSGEWQSLPCFADSDGRQQLNRDACTKFEREYLSKPHAYVVVSAEGWGATIITAPVELDECFDYTGKATYSGGTIATSAIAASSSDFFSFGPTPHLLSDAETKPFLTAFAAAVPGGLDSNSYLTIFSVRLEGQELNLIQRSYAATTASKSIFAVGKVHQGRFEILHWKENVVDEDESLLGTVHLKSGRDFLITTVTDPEGHWFRVYGIQQGRLVRVFSGGGSSC